jgi:hypothetical protein
MTSRRGYGGGELGVAGELMFRAEVLLRGHQVLVPVADAGVDVFVGDVGVQIKASRSEPSRIARYQFNLMGQQSSVARLAGGWSSFVDEVDVFAFACVSEEFEWRWFLIPRERLAGVPFSRLIRLNLAPTRKPSRFDFLHEYEDAWHVLG